jgi:protocatechuate 3,4-dioxygenase beta subunit
MYVTLANATGVYGGFPATLGSGGGGGGGGNSIVRNETFLRGGWYTNDEGIVEITTLYAGYYQGRAPHVHTMVHLDWEQAANG